MVDHLKRLGVTALELLPIHAFIDDRHLVERGLSNYWGYNTLGFFAPEMRYAADGPLDAFRSTVSRLHDADIEIILDVVYNHFGPEGNYLHRYAPPFFARQRTPWGEAIDYACAAVRAFFRHNALYWLEEYHLDGLRLDAAQAMRDDSTPHILEEIATAVHEAAAPGRQIHLVLENDDNAARYLARAEDGRPRLYTAQWNDDFHHIAVVAMTGRNEAYYTDYQGKPQDPEQWLRQGG